VLSEECVHGRSNDIELLELLIDTIVSHQRGRPDHRRGYSHIRKEYRSSQPEGYCLLPALVLREECVHGGSNDIELCESLIDTIVSHQTGRPNHRRGYSHIRKEYRSSPPEGYCLLPALVLSEECVHGGSNDIELLESLIDTIVSHQQVVPTTDGATAVSARSTAVVHQKDTACCRP
jgi:hypothetical protein